MAAAQLLKRPEVRYADLVAIERVGSPGGGGPLEEELREQLALSLETAARYAGYIERQNQEIEKQRKHQSTPLPENLDYARVRGLSNEVREKLERLRPESIGHASRISGVTPAAISLLLIHLKKVQRRRIA
jgi:tRNA uridine 5-carboxymethylaminomethyl modification enzyme